MADAPREVWIVDGEALLYGHADRLSSLAPNGSAALVVSALSNEAVGGVRYVRADLSPSAQPPADSAWQPAEPSAQVRRLAEALRSCLEVLTHPETIEALFGSPDHSVPLAATHELAVREAAAILASPEAPASDSQARHARVREALAEAEPLIGDLLTMVRSFDESNLTRRLSVGRALDRLRAALETP